MNEKDIIDFKNELKNFTIEELTEKRDELNAQISKMLLENDVVMKAAIVEALLIEKLDAEQESHNG